MIVNYITRPPIDSTAFRHIAKNLIAAMGLKLGFEYIGASEVNGI